MYCGGTNALEAGQREMPQKRLPCVTANRITFTA
jgi:hypothetical protein